MHLHDIHSRIIKVYVHFSRFVVLNQPSSRTVIITAAFALDIDVVLTISTKFDLFFFVKQALATDVHRKFLNFIADFFTIFS